MTRQEWRGRLNLTGDPEVDRANREAMLDRLAESMNAAASGMRDVGRTAESVIRVGEAIVGEPVPQIEGATTEGEEQ